MEFVKHQSSQRGVDEPPADFLLRKKSAANEGVFSFTFFFVFASSKVLIWLVANSNQAAKTPKTHARLSPVSLQFN